MVVDIRVGVDMQPDRGRSSIKYYRIIKFIFLNRKQASGSRGQGGGEKCSICAQFGRSRLYSQSQQQCMSLPQFSSRKLCR